MSDNPDPGLADLFKQLITVCSQIVKKLSGQNKQQIMQDVEQAVEQNVSPDQSGSQQPPNQTNQNC